MSISSLDYDIAQHYAKLVLRPVKYGESGFAFWFPGAGKSKILNDIFESKAILKSELGKLADVCVVWRFWGHLAENLTASEVLKQLKVESLSELIDSGKGIVNEGKELIVVGDRLEELGRDELTKLLRLLAALKSTSHNRIHILLNSVDKPMIEEIIVSNPEVAGLSQNFLVIPVLEGKQLDVYISEKSKVYKNSNTKFVKEKFGGILLLTKEAIRTGGDSRQVEMKFSSIYSRLSLVYKTAIDQLVLGAKPKNELERKAHEDLISMGVCKLTVFRDLFRLTKSDPEAYLKNILSDKELKIWNLLSERPNKLTAKELIGEVLWGEDLEKSYSEWAIDQAMSRLRKKLEVAGVDRDKIQTLKGKGYRWQT